MKCGRPLSPFEAGTVSPRRPPRGASVHSPYEPDLQPLVSTAAVPPCLGERRLDQLPLSEDLAAESISVIGNMFGERKLSDHFGVGAVLTSRRASHG